MTLFIRNFRNTLAARAGGIALATALLIIGLNPGIGWGCACGCYVFDVQTGGMFPVKPGGTAFLEYDFMNQNKNWNGASRGSDDNNDDKQLRTHYFTAGAQYMFNRQWGIMGDLPYWNRYFKTTDDDGNLNAFTKNSIGDIRIQGIYSGFSPDMSTGITFGIKLPTGNYTDPNFDRDSSIGTGSTDLLLGAYHSGAITADGHWVWFANGLLDQPVLIAAQYRPGTEVDAVLGGYYNDWRIGSVKFAPLAQIVGAYRWRDTGQAADFDNSGYHRILLAPGFELVKAPWRLFVAVGFPVYQYVNGNQLVTSEFYKLNVSYNF